MIVKLAKTCWDKLSEGKRLFIKRFVIALILTEAVVWVIAKIAAWAEEGVDAWHGFIYTGQPIIFWGFLIALCIGWLINSGD